MQREYSSLAVCLCAMEKQWGRRLFLYFHGCGAVFMASASQSLHEPRDAAVLLSAALGLSKAGLTHTQRKPQKAHVGLPAHVMKLVHKYKRPIYLLQTFKSEQHILTWLSRVAVMPIQCILVLGSKDQGGHASVLYSVQINYLKSYCKS